MTLTLRFLYGSNDVLLANTCGGKVEAGLPGEEALAVTLAEAVKNDDVPERGQIDAMRLVFRNRLFRVNNNNMSQLTHCESIGLFFLSFLIILISTIS
jgi:hypothetical protein